MALSFATYSTADIPPELIRRCVIAIVPLMLISKGLKENTRYETLKGAAGTDSNQLCQR